MRILLTFDTNYAPHAATVMESIIQNCPEKLDFVIIYFDLNKETQDIFTQHFALKVKSIEFIRMDEERLKSIAENINAVEHLGLNTYLRLFATELLPNDRHIIYLDCDIIVNENILRIIDGADLSKPICAVTEYDPMYKLNDLNSPDIKKPLNPWISEALWYRIYFDLEMDCKHSKYFNAGVMVMNLDYWRDNKITEKSLRFMVENPEKIFYGDQDALNFVINGNHFPLNLRWNFVPDTLSIFNNYPLSVLKEIQKNPAIIHTAGTIKPWKYLCDSKFKNLYKYYRKFTPWPKVVYKDITLKNVLKKCIVQNIEKLLGKRSVEMLKTFAPGKEKYWVYKISKMRVR